jgi:hypothetical protein
MEKKNFDYFQFFKWLAVGFSIAGFGVAITVVLALVFGKKFF